jgi:serine/threonine protein kinase
MSVFFVVRWFFMVLCCAVVVKAKARTQIGTPYYLSPEICQDKPYDNKSDMWYVVSHSPLSDAARAIELIHVLIFAAHKWGVVGVGLLALCCMK